MTDSESVGSDGSSLSQSSYAIPSAYGSPVKESHSTTADTSHSSSSDEDVEDDVSDISSENSFASDEEGEKPPGISPEALKTFFIDQPLSDNEEDRKDRKRHADEERRKKLGVDVSENMLKQAEAEIEKRTNELTLSQHSLKSCEQLLRTLSTDDILDDIDLDDPLMEEICIAEGLLAAESRKFKSEKKDQAKDQAKDETEEQTEDQTEEQTDQAIDQPKDQAIDPATMSLMKDQKDLRMAKVRERIRAKQEAQEKEEEKKRMEKFLAAPEAFDTSEDARRERAYGWYTRMAMPTRDKMKERVEAMPASSGTTSEDVDLLPWNYNGTVVNVAKMNKFLNNGFKKKYASRRSATEKTTLDSD